MRKKEVKSEIKIENNHVEQPKVIEQPKQEEPKVIEQPKQEESKENNSFSKKLDDLFTMGFSDRKKNIQLLIKNKGDIHQTIQDLIN